MKKRIALGILAFLTIVNVAALVFFARNHFAPPPPPAPPVVHHRLAKRLDLRKEQLQQLKKIRRDFHRQTRPLRDSLRENHAELIEKIQQEQIDSLAVDSLLEHIARLQTSMHRQAIYSMHREGQKLSPDQRDKFYEFFQRRVCDRALVPTDHRNHGCRPPRAYKKGEPNGKK